MLFGRIACATITD